MKRIKRFLCVFLSLLMMINAPSLTTLAAGDDEIALEATENATENALDEATDAALDEAEDAALDFSTDSAIAEESDGAEVTIDEVTEAESAAEVEATEADEKGTAAAAQVTASANKSAATIGSTVVITAKASGTSGAVSYQWYMSNDGQTWKKTSLSGNATNKLTYEATSGLFVYSFRCTVKDSKGTYYSNAVKVDKAEKPIVKATPSTKAAVPGTEVTITASATNTVGTACFQWYFSNDGGQTWKKTQLDGNGTKKLNFTATAGLLAYSYRVAVTDSNGVWYSDPVSIKKASAPVITVRPSSPAAIYGTAVTINATVSGTTGGVTYQWYMSTDGENWKKTSMEGSTTKTLSFEASSGLLAYSYRIQVKDDAGIWYSDPVKIAKGEKPIVTAKANKTSAFIGDSITITANVTNSNGNIAYQWYTSADGQTWKKTSLEGATTKSLSFVATAGLLSYVYRVQVKDDLGYWYSDPVSFRKAETPIVKATARKEYAEAGETVSITAAPSNTIGNVTYQWYVSTDGENWKKTTLTGSKTATLSFVATAALLKNYYRVGVKDSNGMWYSNSVKLKNVTANVTVPVVTINGKTNAVDKKQFDYDRSANGAITLKWSAENGNDKYDVEAYLMNDKPAFGTNQSYVSVVKKVENVKTTTLKISAEDLKKARYLKVKITARDKFYGYNQKTQSIEFSIRFNRYVAVLVANGDYQSANDLAGPPYDLSVMTKTLKNLAQDWEVYGYADQTATGMQNAIARNFADTEEGDVCLFYYSGHGTDYPLGALCGVDSSYFTPAQLANSLNNNTKGKVIVLLDSCFSGGAIDISAVDDSHFITSAKQSKSGKDFNQAILNAFEEAEAKNAERASKAGELCVDNKYYVLTACGQDQTSLDAGRDGYRCGLFTESILKALGVSYPNATFSNEIPGDVNGDKCLSIYEAYDYATQVIAESHIATVNAFTEAYYEMFYDDYWYYVNSGTNIQDYYPTFEDYWAGALEYYIGDMQVTCGFGKPSFVLFRRK